MVGLMGPVSLSSDSAIRVERMEDCGFRDSLSSVMKRSSCLVKDGGAGRACLL
jgi:hypothetical protein